MHVFVTGCNGYIGSHVVKKLSEFGYKVNGLDFDKTENYEKVKKYLDEFFLMDIRLLYRVAGIQKKYDAIIHCAALISVPNSIEFPIEYYKTNISGTINTIDAIEYDHFIFASSGGVLDAQSPYSTSKQLGEQVVRDLCPQRTVFRFFNVSGNAGFSHVDSASHIIHKAARVAAGKDPVMYIYGDDYPTPDGTCIRDYVHVEDVAETMVRSVCDPSKNEYDGIGLQQGYSNLEVVETMKRVTEKDFKVEIAPRRPGDPPRLVSDIISHNVIINHTLGDMCLSAYEWEKEHD